MIKVTNTNVQQQVHGGKGFILLSRDILNSPYYFSESFTKSAAWIDLLLLASFKGGTFYVRGILVNISRGQLGLSQISLAKRWGWSIKKVTRFLNGLKTTGQIDYQNNNVTTLITIHSYDNAMGMGFQTEGQKHTKSTANDLHYNKVKKEKNIYTSPQFFYQEELKQPHLHPDYEKLVSLILGNNDLHRPLEAILMIPEQLSSSQFNQLVDKHKKGGTRPLSEILILIENDSKYTKGKQSLFVVLNNWLSNDFKNEKKCT